MFGFDRRQLAAVFAGGAIGTLARAIFETLAAPDPGHWPWPTFVVNVVGAFLLGWLAVRLPELGHSRPMLCTGLCGGLTTFSTMQVEILKMLEHRHFALAAGYATASVAAGLLAVWGATSWARR